ncbi:sensor histidine kinase [Desulfonema magnum]|uniref:histidine kinase n=1 Tax=Desulfonema magnum TaxID=45655 RepID=A0A975GQ85_9BACT|nr:HAMP domain-containing sensor histidine kinase [Desulfonema magnum]QTA89786.1 Two component system histidine kinase [Desulfonema magnum]
MTEKPIRIPKPLRLLPGWKGNLLVFGLLIIIVLGYFFWQARQAHRTFLNHAREHSRMLAGVIELNARGAVLSQGAVEEIMQTFLGNMARFADYLDTVEPFSEDELAAFALEAGLAGIRIIRDNGEFTQGPPGWFSPSYVTCTENVRVLQHLATDHLYFLTLPREAGEGCVVVGLTAVHIEKLHEQVGLSHLLHTLSELAGIRYVRIESFTSNPPKAEVILIDKPDKKLAETRLPFDEGILVVALEAGHFFFRIRQLWNEFFLFSAILAILGVFFSWILHRYQNAYLNRIRDVERELARQREDAALGRAAAAITHEIRNPLNAISIGLQRLQIEADDLDDEYQSLVSTMLRAVRRTNSIVTNIRQYAGPLTPQKKPVRLNSMLNHILALYAQKCEEHSVEVKCEIRHNEPVAGDPDMLEQVLENLIKNGIEAQPEGGDIRIILDHQGREAVLTIENSGFSLSESEADQIFEPYFTTKTRGTGLGLAIVRRIVHSHGGRLELQVPRKGVLCVFLYLPLANSD